jgi:hypothetical protein
METSPAKAADPIVGHKKMTKEEKIIRNLRRRRSRIVAIIIVTVLMAGALIFMGHRKMKLDALITPENIHTFMADDNSQEKLPEMLYTIYNLATYDNKLMRYFMFLACSVGVLIGLLIGEVANITNKPLLISMWDKIQRLEREVQEAKGCSTDGQQPIGHISSESVSSESSGEHSS